MQIINQCPSIRLMCEKIVVAKTYQICVIENNYLFMGHGYHTEDTLAGVNYNITGCDQIRSKQKKIRMVYVPTL